jgi:hypothetical protein
MQRDFAQYATVVEVEAELQQNLENQFYIDVLLYGLSL